MSLEKETLIKKLTEDFGQNRNHLVIKTEAELEDLFIEFSKKKLEEQKKAIAILLQEYVQEELDDIHDIKESAKYWRELSNNLKNPKKLYEIIDEMVRKIDISIINEMIDNHTNEQTYSVIFKKVRVKFRQFQEELLDEIIKEFAIFPEEEQYNQIEKLNKNKENINKLKHILATIKDPKTNESLRMLAGIKKEILKNYFPDVHDMEYRGYVQNVVVKRQIIDQIVDMKAGYTKEDLLSKDVDDLRNLKDFLIEEHNSYVKSRKLLNRYLKGFEEQFHIKDDTSLSLFAKEARKELNYEQMKEIVENMKNYDSVFGEKLNLMLIGIP